MSTIQPGQIEKGDAPIGGLRFVVALKPEADPLIEHFEMRPASIEGPFRCWANGAGGHWLVVSGIGKTSAAAASTWLHAVSGADPAAAWINLGIAGHPTLDPGEIRRVHKVTDPGTGRSWYPPQVIGGKSGIESEALITVDRPVETFTDDDSLVDMEACGFIEVAGRFTTLELVHCLKIVSDNAETGFEDLKGNKGRISRLVFELVERADDSSFFEAIEDASAAEAWRLGPPPGYSELVSNVHFTESQKHQLKRILKRLAALKIEPQLNGTDARGILRNLKARIPPAP